MIDFNHVIHDIQIASTVPKEPDNDHSGEGAAWILDGGWPEVIKRKIEPWKDVLARCAGVQVWLPGLFEPKPGPIRYATKPTGNFRVGLDARILRLIDSYRDEFVRPLRLLFGIRKVFTYCGCLPEDDVLFEAALQDRYDLELRRQTMPWAGTTVIIDQWAEATLNDAPTLRRIANMTCAGEVGIEGTVRKAGPVAGSRLIKLWLRSKLLTGAAYYTPEETATLPGMKIEMLRGWAGDKRQRAEHLTNLTTEGKPTPIHVCVGIDALL